MKKKTKHLYLVKEIYERGEFYFDYLTEKEAEKLKKSSQGRLSIERRTE